MPATPGGASPSLRSRTTTRCSPWAGRSRRTRSTSHPWLGTEKALLREAVAGGMPVLGVCLGCQLLADAHGGTVEPLAEAEVGIIDFALTEAGRADPLFAGLPAAPLTMQWHLNAVTAMPRQAVLLATSEACAVQAYRLAPRAYGVQFHMEVDAALVQATEAFPEYIAALERDQGAGAFARMVADAVREEETLRANGSRLFRNFVGLMEAGGTQRAAE